MEELAAADVHRLVVNVARGVAEEEDVAGLKVGSIDVLADVHLRVGDAGQVDAHLFVGVLDDSRAVEPGRGIVATPLVRRTHVLARDR